MRHRRRTFASAISPQESDILALSPIAWWKPDESRVTKDGADRLSQVNDISGNANHLLQSTGAEQPLWVDAALNGRPTMRFDDVDNNFDLTSTLSTPGAISVFFVYKPNSLITASSSFNSVLRDNDSSKPYTLYGFGALSGAISLETFSLASVGTTGNFFDHIRDEISASPHLFMTTLSGTTSVFKIDRDSKTVFKDAAEGGLDSDDADKRMNNVDQIGDEPTQSLDGDLFELMIFDSLLSDANITVVENYIQGQYGI